MAKTQEVAAPAVELTLEQRVERLEAAVRTGDPVMATKVLAGIVPSTEAEAE